MNKSKTNIPEYLCELDCSSPSSWRKLIAAWDGLNVETQIIFLKHIKRINYIDRSPFFESLLHEHALNSHNAYIRYLAAKWLINNDASEEILEKIDNDSSLLVKNCKYECKEWSISLRSSEENTKKLFLEISHEARLAFLRDKTESLRYGIVGELLFEIVKNAKHTTDSKIKKSTITWDEIDEILNDFVSQENLQEQYLNRNRYFIDGMSDFYCSKDLKKLWQVAILLPSGVGRKYIENLPTQSYMFKITKDIAIKLAAFNFDFFLRRKDVDLYDFRKQLFLDKTKSSSTKSAAVSNHFNLDIDEFISFVENIKENKSNNQEVEFSPYHPT